MASFADYMNANNYNLIKILSLCALISMSTEIYWGIAKENKVADKNPRLDEEEYQLARNTFDKVQKAIIAGDIATVKSNCDTNFLLLISGKATETSPHGINWSKAKAWFMSNQAEAVLYRDEVVLTKGSDKRIPPDYPIYYPLRGFKEKYSAFIAVHYRKSPPCLYAKFDVGTEVMDTKE